MDSGLGGLTIAQAILTQLPQAQLVYLADTAFFPYGIRTEQEITRRMTRIALPLAREVSADIVVIACNSASTTVLPALRQQTSRPIVGVVPAIKPAAKLTHTGCIGLLATPGTVERHYTNELINTYANHIQVVRKGSSELVHWAEQKMQGIAPSPQQLEHLLADWQHDTLDTVVLGCTHFPLLREELSQALPNVKYWVDSGDAIARRVASLLPNPSLTTESTITKQPTNVRHRLLTTDLTTSMTQTESSIQRRLSIAAKWELWRLPK